MDRLARYLNALHPIAIRNYLRWVAVCVVCHARLSMSDRLGGRGVEFADAPLIRGSVREEFVASPRRRKCVGFQRAYPCRRSRACTVRFFFKKIFRLLFPKMAG